jgi:hypothetical protein
MLISHHVLGQLVYPLCQQGDLNLSRAGVFFTEPKFAYGAAFLLFIQIIPLSPVILANINYIIN